MAVLWEVAGGLWPLRKTWIVCIPLSRRSTPRGARADSANSDLGQVFQAYAAKHFSAYPVGHGIDDLGTVLGWIDMTPKWTGTQWHSDDFDDGFGHFTDIRVSRFQGCQTFECLIRHTGVRAFVVFGGSNLICRGTGMGEVVGALGEMHPAR